MRVQDHTRREWTPRSSVAADVVAAAEPAAVDIDTEIDTAPVGPQRVARGLAIVGLAVTAWVHVPVAVDHMTQLPALGITFYVFVLACAGLAGSLLAENRLRVWRAVLALSVAAIGAYLVSRTLGLPGDADDIGDWFNSAGIAAIASEALVVLVSATVLLRRRQHG